MIRNFGKWQTHNKKIEALKVTTVSTKKITKNRCAKKRGKTNVVNITQTNRYHVQMSAETKQATKFNCFTKRGGRAAHGRTSINAGR